MAITIFYLYGIWYLIRDIKGTFEAFTTNNYEESRKESTEAINAVHEMDISKAREINEKYKNEFNWWDLIPYVITAFWLIGGLKTDQYPHFLFLIFLSPLLIILKGISDKSVSWLNQYKAIDIMGTVLRISTVGIIFYKHFYVDVV